MGLHSSGWESTAALTQRPRVRIPLKPRNPFFSGFFAIAQIAIHCDGHIFISFVFPQFTSFHTVKSNFAWAFFFFPILSLGGLGVDLPPPPAPRQNTKSIEAVTMKPKVNSRHCGHFRDTDFDSYWRDSVIPGCEKKNL